MRRVVLLLAVLGAVGLTAAGARGSSSELGLETETANPIRAENAQRGTTAWQTPDSDGPAIEGYASEVSAVAGDTLRFHVSTKPASRYHIEVYRLGWYGGTGGRLLACIPRNCADSLTGKPQAAGEPGAGGIVRAGWPVTATLTIPRVWTTGYLMVRFRLPSGRAATTYVVLRDRPDRHSSILVQVPVNTWQAYNGWGGMSLYEFDYSGRRRADHVSFDRPYAWDLQGGQSPLVWEIQTVRFLERMGYDVSYQTDVDTHRDPNSLLRHRLVVDNGHDEYWTKETFDAFEAARNRGTNLAFMGANDAYWQVRYADSGRTIVSYKSFSDPIADPLLETVRFRELTPPRYECTLIGIQHQGVGLRWPPGGYTVQPASLSDPWMAGTKFGAGDTVAGAVSVESDTIPGSQSAASSCTHPLTVFFHRERGGDKDGNADAIRYVDFSGARVFASGSHQWSWALDSFRSRYGQNVPADRRVQTFMTNAFADLLRPAPPAGVTAKVTRSSVVLTASLHTDPRVTSVRFMRSAGGGPVVCAGSTGCVDHPPGHRAYTYGAVTVDPWGVSLPTAAAAVRVPNTPPVLAIRGPRTVSLGSVHRYRAAVFDSDGDAVRMRWRVNGAPMGAGSRVDVEFDQAGPVLIKAAAADGHGGKARAKLVVLARS